MGQIKLNNKAVVKFGLLHDCQYLKNDKHWQGRTRHLTTTHTYTHTNRAKELYKNYKNPKELYKKIRLRTNWATFKNKKDWTH